GPSVEARVVHVVVRRHVLAVQLRRGDEPVVHGERGAPRGGALRVRQRDDGVGLGACGGRRPRRTRPGSGPLGSRRRARRGVVRSVRGLRGRLGVGRVLGGRGLGRVPRVGGRVGGVVGRGALVAGR